jgi:iron complex transport system ATP-binding protein
MSLLTTRDLGVQIAGRPICSSLDLALAAGEVWAILGRNGAGKTTLLHTLAGLRPAQAGSVQLEGRDLNDWDGMALARRRGVMFQDSNDTFPATVLETALTGRHPHLSFWALESAQDRALAQAALAEVELAADADRLVNTLSGGERRRVAIATLLVQSPAVWLLDEPSNHLDLRHQVDLLSLLVRRAQQDNGLILMTLHDVNLALRFCTHALLLVDADTVLSGPVSQVINAENLQRLYGHGVVRLQGEGGREGWIPD